LEFAEAMATKLGPSDHWVLNGAGRKLLSAGEERALGRKIEAARRRGYRQLLAVPEVRAELSRMAKAALKLTGNGSTRQSPLAHDATARALKQISREPGCLAARRVLPASAAFDTMLKLAEACAPESRPVVAAAKASRRHRAHINQLVEHNILLVMMMARQYPAGGAVGFNDLVQEGSLGLIHAAELWDWRRGLKFSTYAYHWVRHSIQTAMAKHRNIVSIPQAGYEPLRVARLEARHASGETAIDLEGPGRNRRIRSLPQSLSLHGEAGDLGLDETLPDDAAGPEEIVEGLDGASKLARLMAQLPERERAVLEARYGFREDEMTHHEVAQLLGVSKSTSANIEERAVKRLRVLIAR
jgi:RNA polymerase primary sigma factor